VDAQFQIGSAPRAGRFRFRFDDHNTSFSNIIMRIKWAASVGPPTQIWMDDLHEVTARISEK
jgi:hypothetical protein